MTAHLLRGIGELTTNDPSLGDGTALGRLHHAAMIFDAGRVAWVGPEQAAPPADTSTDVGGAAVVPGFVDSHAHVVFAGDRAIEFAGRMAGQAHGGGILTTVEATRRATDDELRAATAARVLELRHGGVTTLESKSGYDLTVSGEVRLLRLSAEVADEVTFLGAHVIPPEFASNRDGYVELVAGEMLEQCAPLARWADVFCDEGAFTVDEARTILAAARARGLGLRLHAHQRAATGAIELAVSLGAASVDHCTLVSDRDVALLAGSGTVATLLPGAEFQTRTAAPSARRLIDAGVTVALATDCNPGTSYLTSMSLVLALAVREMGLTVDEALLAVTRGGAEALRRTDVGWLGVGARADAVVVDGPSATHLVYRPGRPRTLCTYRGGVPDRPVAPALS